ncbi:hypothetical protein CERSUDRAFT_117843 [Gelatoporia subvermispora B]|uniref:Uncharacterized protein n=1 Tax=Ceriporiopsis subvermispora (strain B) TaxID=914234 RepID=M2R4A2_CERS8|nr:hypothetical protein CERSUDRAFT_117843 [Gelatoporia subvermispora B]
MIMSECGCYTRSVNQVSFCKRARAVHLQSRGKVFVNVMTNIQQTRISPCRPCCVQWSNFCRPLVTQDQRRHPNEAKTKKIQAGRPDLLHDYFVSGSVRRRSNPLHPSASLESKHSRSSATS